MLCARMQHEGQSSWDRNYPTLTLSPHREVGPNCHCDSRMLQKERYHWWVTGKQSEDWQCQQNHNVFWLWRRVIRYIHPGVYMVPVKWRAKEDGHHHPLYHCTNQAHVPTKERVCIWKKNRDSSETGQNIGVSREDADIMYMFCRNIQFTDRYQQWDNTLRTAALWQVNINETII